MFYFCSVDTEIDQLAQMRQIAFDLGMSFGQAAMAEADLDRKLTLFDAYCRSFSSMRLAISLKMRIQREARMTGRDRPRPEVERDEAVEAPETERTERLEELERERDRDTERVSLPILLRTLGRVADDAETLLPGAAQLPTLRELLVRVKAQPAPEHARPGRAATGAQPLANPPLRRSRHPDPFTATAARPARPPGPPAPPIHRPSTALAPRPARSALISNHGFHGFHGLVERARRTARLGCSSVQSVQSVVQSDRARGAARPAPPRISATPIAARPGNIPPAPAL